MMFCIPLASEFQDQVTKTVFEHLAVVCLDDLPIHFNTGNFHYRTLTSECLTVLGKRLKEQWKQLKSWPEGALCGWERSVRGYKAIRCNFRRQAGVGHIPVS